LNEYDDLQDSSKPGQCVGEVDCILQTQSI